METYDKYVAKRIPTYCSVRWNIKYNILNVFVEHHEEIFKFLKLYEDLGKPFKNPVNSKDLEIAQLLVSILQPYEELTRFMSRNICLSPVYIPLLLHVRGNLTKTNNILKEMGDPNTDFSPAITIVDKYLKQAKDNFNIIYACSSFQPVVGCEVTKFYEEHFEERLDLLRILTDVLVKLGNFQTERRIDNSNWETGFSDPSRDGTNADIINEDTFDNELRNVISRTLDQEYAEYKSFVKEKCELLLEGFLKSKGIYAIEEQEGTVYYKGVREKPKKVSGTEMFLNRIEVFLNLQRKYRDETNKLSSPLNNHIYFPVVMDYLLSFSVTSVNAERSFSKLRRLYGDQRHKLHDSKIFALSNLMSVHHSRLDIDLFDYFEANSLSKVLGFNKNGTRQKDR